MGLNQKPFKNNKGLASLLTFIISALWHGLYIGYYTFSLKYFMLEQIAAFFEEEYDIYSKIEKWNFIYKFIYRIFIMTVVNHYAIGFSLMTWEANYNFFYKAFSFIPLLLLFSVWIFTLISKRTKKVKKID
jgi:hypothetical protein